MRCETKQLHCKALGSHHHLCAVLLLAQAGCNLPCRYLDRTCDCRGDRNQRRNRIPYLQILEKHSLNRSVYGKELAYEQFFYAFIMAGHRLAEAL